MRSPCLALAMERNVQEKELRNTLMKLFLFLTNDWCQRTNFQFRMTLIQTTKDSANMECTRCVIQGPKEMMQLLKL